MKGAKQHIIILSGGLLATTLYILLFKTGGALGQVGAVEILITLIWSGFFIVPLFYSIRFLFHSLLPKDHELSGGVYAFRVILGVFLSIWFAIILGAFLLLINQIVFGEGNSLIPKVTSAETGLILWVLFNISIPVILLLFIFFAVTKYLQKRIKEQKIKAVNITTAHESLKSQIGPHFLFNSLNVLNGLIDENPDKAQEFVGDLGMIYRYVLEQNDQPLVSLKQEIEFAKTYLNLIQKRYEDGLNFEFMGEVDEDVQIVPLSLQILLENCIKHNKISSEEPLKIQVEVQDDKLTVKNNLQPKAQMNDSVGKGLQSIIDRYAYLSPEKVIINKKEDQFVVEIPLLNQNIKDMETKSKYTNEEYLAAKERVEDLQGFYWHLGSFIVVNLFLTLLDVYPDGRYDWAYWPLFGWGLGLFFNAVRVFGFFNNHAWEQRMIQKELEKNRQSRQRFK